MFQRLERDSIEGYSLFDFGSHWELHSPIGIFSGNLKQVFVYAVLELGFESNELEVGILEMEKHFHDSAAYGIFKRFMWTFDRSEKHGKTGTNC